MNSNSLVNAAGQPAKPNFQISQYLTKRIKDGTFEA
jgi:hypothetical protein